MNKRILLTLFLAGLMLTKASAVGVSDIPAIRQGLQKLFQDAVVGLEFAQKLSDLSDAGFSITIIGSTQTVTLTNAQKSGLLAEYQNLKQQMQADFALLP